VSLAALALVLANAPGGTREPAAYQIAWAGMAGIAGAAVAVSYRLRARSQPAAVAGAPAH
jgi:hypothetical protein